jgi:hypothetical protein
MADYDAPAAAEMTLGAAEASFVIDHVFGAAAAAAPIEAPPAAFVMGDVFQAPAAAPVELTAPQPAFLMGDIYQVPAPALFTLLAPEAMFVIEDAYQAAAALFTLQAGQPAFVMAGTDGEYDAPSSPVIDIQAPQPSFVMGPAFHQAFTPWTAARFSLQASQPSFLGGAALPTALPVFAFRPDGGTPVRLTYGYLAEVLSGDNLSEQRRALRSRPSGTLQAAFVLLVSEAPTLPQQFEAAVYRLRGTRYNVPLWPHARVLTADAALSATSIAVDTAEWPVAAGAVLLLWTGPTRYEAVIVDTVGSGTIDLTLPLAMDWASGITRVVPLVPARLASVDSFTWRSYRAVQAALTFDVEAYR